MPHCSEALDVSGSNSFFIEPSLAITIVRRSSLDCLLYEWLNNVIHTKGTSTVSFLLSTGFPCCRDLLLLQQQRKHAFHMIPPLVYIKPALYIFQRASFHLGSRPQCSLHGSMTSRVVFFHRCKLNLFCAVCVVQLQILLEQAAKL